MDAPSPIATTPEARSRQLRALKRADSARRAATPAAGPRRDAPGVQPTNAVGMGALFAPSGHGTPVRRSARSSAASSTPGEDLPPEAARFVARVMSPSSADPVSDLFFSFVPTHRRGRGAWGCPTPSTRVPKRAALPPVVADPAAEARKKRALSQGAKAAARRGSTSAGRRAGKEPASRKGTAARPRQPRAICPGRAEP